MRPVYRLIIPMTLAAAALAVVLLPVRSAAYINSDTASPIQTSFNSERIHPELLHALETAPAGEFIQIIVEWPSDPDLAEHLAGSAPRGTAGHAVVNGLKQDSAQRSAALSQLLDQQVQAGSAKNVRFFWISPVVALQATPELISILSLRADVRQIRPDGKVMLKVPLNEPAPDEASRTQSQWNLEMIQAYLADDALGLDGSGVVVANIDSGVDWQHPALNTSYRGYGPGGFGIHYGNWHVATNEVFDYPADSVGHGSHTMGIMVGDDGQGMRVGVAPGAQWIAVRAFSAQGFAFESWLHDAFEWIIAPEGDPDLAPDIVNNSWNNNAGGNEYLLADLNAVRAAGILPIFSAGNFGPGSNTVFSPADYASVFAVAALDDLGNVAAFSSRGPSYLGAVKPEAAAPGAMILSTIPGGAYAWLSGTSMAAPHVAGVAALLLQGDPGLSTTSLENLLKSTAVPLGTNPPNNTYGWGRVDAYQAGLAVTASGEVAGSVESASGFGLPNAQVSVVPLIGGPAITIAVQTDGSYTLALLPGIYNFSAQAFGFKSETIFSTPVLTGSQIVVDFNLNPEPLGAVFGRITGAADQQPISATLRLDTQLFSTHSDPGSGIYGLALPAGDWPISIRAPGFRVTHITPTISVGVGISLDIFLAPAPRILLVDSGYWYYKSRGFFYQAILDDLDFVYDTWNIRDPFGQNGGPPDLPTLADLSAYDLVIWSAPSDSPGLLGMNDALEGYLGTGGHMILSGQHVALWDGGGSLIVFPEYFPGYFGASFGQDDNFGPLSGEPGSFLEGFSIALNTEDSDKSQLSPDEVEIDNPLMTQAVLRWPDQSIGGLVAGGCEGHRVAWLGFGLEGSGPLDERTDLLSRLIAWTEIPNDPFRVILSSDRQSLIGGSGKWVTETVWINNRGTQTDTYNVELLSDSWPAAVQFANGPIVTGTSQVAIAACSSISLTAMISVPQGVPRDTAIEAVVQSSSVISTAVQDSFTFTVKTPAGILIMDDGRWTKYGYLYEEALVELGMSYDIHLLNGAALTDPDLIKRYPILLWHTSNDWASPLTSDEELLLADYLDAGGRMVFSTMDYLDVLGATEFAQQYFGIVGHNSQAQVKRLLADYANPVIRAFGTWQLVYPFLNWSDTLIPGPGAEPVLLDEFGQVVGLVQAQAQWRTAFYAFPIETLALPDRAELLSQSLVWVSPLGESELHAPPVALAGANLPISLTLGAASTLPISPTRALLPLPLGLQVITGTLWGPWTYVPADNHLLFTGVLSPEQSIDMGIMLSVSPTLAAGQRINLDTQLYAGDGYTLTERTPIWINAPWLATSIAANRLESEHFSTIYYTVTVENLGVMTASFALTNSIPTQSQWISDTLAVSQGTLVSQTKRLLWSGWLAPGQMEQLTYQVTFGFGDPVYGLVNRVEVSAAQQDWIIWQRVLTPGQVILPFVQH
jgi:subtilisin family serine protease